MFRALLRIYWAFFQIEKLIYMAIRSVGLPPAAPEEICQSFLRMYRAFCKSHTMYTCNALLPHNMGIHGSRVDKQGSFVGVQRFFENMSRVPFSLYLFAFILMFSFFQ